MSMILFLGCAAIGTALSGLTIAYDVLSCEEIKDKITDETKIYSTQMNNEELLKKSLDELGMKIKDDSNLEMITNKGEILFFKNDEGNYDIIFNGDFTDNEINSFAEELYEFYTSFVQEETYNRVLKEIEKNNYQLDSEQVTDDSSIILTINI